MTHLNKIFVWWNQATIGTMLKTIFFGKLVGKDSQGNKFYESKSKKRWIIYSGEIDASKISSDWYSWMHFTNNKIENIHDLERYKWQKPHQSNQTGTANAYHPNKKNNEIEKKYSTWKN